MKGLPRVATVFLAGVGAGVLGLALLAGGGFGVLSLVTRGEDDPDSFRSLPSPGGGKKAVLIQSSGGGAPSGYCNTVVSVAPSETSNEDAKGSEFEVFAAPCASFELQNGVMAQSPLVEWVSPSILKITFSTADMRGEIETVRLRSNDASRDVAIWFVASERPL